MNLITTHREFYLLILFIVFGIGCLESSAKPNNALVKSKGVVIEATNDNEVISIEAGEGLERTSTERTSESQYLLPGHGFITMQVPISWFDTISQPPKGSPPTITIKPLRGNSFVILITPIWPTNYAILSPSKDTIRQRVKHAAEKIKDYAEEIDINVLELKSASVFGYYFSATDKAPKPGEYKFMTQGMLGVGELTVSFTILTNYGQEDVIQDALTMLKSASQLVPDIESDEAISSTNLLDEKYDLHAKGATWSLQFPKSGFKLEKIKQENGGKSIYSYFSNSNGLNVSFYIEPATFCLTAKECRKHQVDNPSESIKVAQYIKDYEINGYAIVEYFLKKAGPDLTKLIPELKDRVVNQNNINAHYVKNGYWMDIHLSKCNFAENDRVLFDNFIKSLKFVER